MASKLSTYPTPYKVSTITATASLTCSQVDSLELYHSVVIEPNTDNNGVVFIEYGVKKGTLHHKGFHKKLLVTRRRKKETKRFDNQVTILIRIINKEENQPNVPELTNMKIFRNGNIQMTGLKTVEQGQRAMDFIVSHIKDSSYSIVEDKDVVKIQNYDIRLINSDFCIGFHIKRDKLYKIMQDKYHTFCTYEPCIYPGVKIQYNFNKQDSNNDGMCRCKCKCTGKGTSEGEGQCKKITIAVFQSGCIIITGARSYEQVDIAYNYICTIIKKHSDEIKKVAYVDSVSTSTKRLTLFL